MGAYTNSYLPENYNRCVSRLDLKPLAGDSSTLVLTALRGSLMLSVRLPFVM